MSERKMQSTDGKALVKQESLLLFEAGKLGGFVIVSADFGV